MRKNNLNVAVTCIIFGVVVFIAGYQLGKARYQRLSTIPVISVATHEKAMREVTHKYRHPGTLAHPMARIAAFRRGARDDVETM